MTEPAKWFPCLNTGEYSAALNIAQALGAGSTYIRKDFLRAIFGFAGNFPNRIKQADVFAQHYRLSEVTITEGDQTFQAYLLNRPWMVSLYLYLLNTFPIPLPRTCRQATFVPGQPE